MQATTNTASATTINSTSLDLEAVDNATLIDFVLDNNDATEIECEMASRLIECMEEIDRLVAERAELLGRLEQVQH